MTFQSLLQKHNIQLQQETKATGFISVPGAPVDMPVTVIAGKKPGKNILITGGVHGGEYPCIETAIRLAGRLQPRDVSGGWGSFDGYWMISR